VRGEWFRLTAADLKLFSSIRKAAAPADLPKKVRVLFARNSADRDERIERNRLESIRLDRYLAALREDHWRRFRCYAAVPPQTALSATLCLFFP
jgi:hypothetical protein